MEQDTNEPQHGGDRYPRYEATARAQGRLRLKDDTHEAVAKLLSDGVEDSATAERLNLSADDLAAIKSEALFVARFEYLKDKSLRQPEPRTQAEYFQGALKGLWGIYRSSKDEDVKIKALKELAIVAKNAPDQKQQAAKGSAELDELKNAFGGGSD
jgi:hypothetical protein